jgi:hypothetical protein
MVTPYILALVWMVCGGIAWKIATTRKGNGPLFGPFSIPFAFLAKSRN